jgi:hypothetical protein
MRLKVLRAQRVGDQNCQIQEFLNIRTEIKTTTRFIAQTTQCVCQQRQRARSPTPILSPYTPTHISETSKCIRARISKHCT